MDDVFFTDKQLCDRWHCTPMTLYRWRAQGLLSAPVKINGIKSKNLTPVSEVKRLEEVGGHNGHAAS
jgi:hypothetical protein